jgi:hypothetical protein
MIAIIAKGKVFLNPIAKETTAILIIELYPRRDLQTTLFRIGTNNNCEALRTEKIRILE